MRLYAQNTLVKVLAKCAKHFAANIATLRIIKIIIVITNAIQKIVITM